MFQDTVKVYCVLPAQGTDRCHGLHMSCKILNLRCNMDCERPEFPRQVPG